MEHFLVLPDEKQFKIIDAALTVFGRNGYKKASVSDIAAEAGISKAMVFYYFGSKKALYLYLAEKCVSLIMSEIEGRFEKRTTGFFDRLRMLSEFKLSVMRRHPAMLIFLNRMVNETDEEIKNDIKLFRSSGEEFRWEYFSEGTDTSGLRDDIDPKLLLTFIGWASEGFSNSLPSDGILEKMDDHLNDFYRVLDIMEKYFNK